MKQILQGLSDFLRRYVTVFAAAWKVRAQLDPPKRSADELAFLPAHLELTDTPVSPLPRWTMRVIIAFFCVALLWACLGQVEIVAVASGKVVVTSGTKVIQPIETAVVRRILVRDGKAVKQGELLIELDATATGADVSQVGEALLNARLAERRLTALVVALDSHRAPTMPSDIALPYARLDAERALARSQYAAFVAKRNSLRAQIAQRESEVQTTETTIHSLDATARIARARAEDLARLVEGKYVGRHDYLQREQERIAAERDLAAMRGRLNELRSVLRGAREELQVLTTDVRRQTLDELRQAREEIGQLTPESAKARERNRLMQLRAPVDGTVQQMAVHTVGGVVTPAQPLMLVVPAEEVLEVEATVKNKDIGFVRSGQPVRVKVESFPYTRYGYLDGVVETVSHDAAQDEKLGLVFPARVKLARGAISVEGIDVRLRPGMALSVEIKTGRRLVIDYLLSPLKTAASEGLRER